MAKVARSAAGMAMAAREAVAMAAREAETAVLHRADGAAVAGTRLQPPKRFFADRR
jgi:hypothetical protein